MATDWLVPEKKELHGQCTAASDENEVAFNGLTTNRLSIRRNSYSHPRSWCACAASAEGFERTRKITHMTVAPSKRDPP